MATVEATADSLKLRVAAELARGRWRPLLKDVSLRLANGDTWESAVENLRPRSSELHALMCAAMDAGQPADIILKILQKRSLGRHAWQQMWLATIYPTVLLLLAMIVCALVGMSMLGVAIDYDMLAPSFNPNSGAKVASMQIMDFYDASMGAMYAALWLVVLAATVYCLATPSAWFKLVGSLPLIGRPYRWLGMSEILLRLGVFIEYQPDLVRALRYTAQSFGRSAIGPIIDYVRLSIERGQSFPIALHSTIVSDSRAGLVLTLIDSNRLSASALQSSQMLNEMIAQSCARLRTIYPIFVLLFVCSLIWSIWAGYMQVMQLYYRAFIYW